MNFYSDTAHRIARAYSLLSAAHRKIADFLLGAPMESATMTIEELSKACGVSIATTNRFAKAIGFDGFTELRAHRIEALRQALTPVEKLKTDQNDAATGFDLVIDGVAQDIANLERLRDTLNRESCDAAVGLILGAARIFTYGAGISRHIAGILTHGLEPFCRGDVAMVGDAGGLNSALRRIVHAGPGDLVILISFPRYATETLDLLDMARERRTAILSITDNPSSPLAAPADVALYVPAERRLLPNSATAAFALADGLAAAVANRRREGIEVQMRLAARHMPRPRETTPPSPPPRRRPD